MKCREAKQEIALYLGNDGSDRARWEQVRHHVSGCISCRVHYGRLKKALRALDQSDTTPTYESQDSLWPGLQQQLQAMPVRKRPRNIQNWMPLAGVTVACVLMMSFLVTMPGDQENTVSQPPVGRNLSSDPFTGWSRAGRTQPDSGKRTLKVTDETLFEGP